MMESNKSKMQKQQFILLPVWFRFSWFYHPLTIRVAVEQDLLLGLPIKIKPGLEIVGMKEGIDPLIRPGPAGCLGPQPDTTSPYRHGIGPTQGCMV